MTALECHLQLFDELCRRPWGGQQYRTLLQEIIGFPCSDVIISTSEHLAPFNSLASISFLLPQMAIQRSALRPPKTIVVLAGSLIPLDNADYPRGFVLPAGARPDRFNLFPRRLLKMCPALLSSIKLSDLSEASAFFNRYPWLERIFADDVSFPSYAYQMGACMEKLAGHWLQPNAPNSLRVLPLEDVARQILIRLLESRDPIIERLLFNEHTRACLFRKLHGVFCAWGNTQGSFLFWAAEGGRLIRLREECGELVGMKTRVRLQSHSLLQALRSEQLWPGVFLSLLCVSYLPNLPIAGGPKQLHYFQAMILAVNDLLVSHQETSLSQFGYNSVDLSGMRTSPACEGSLLSERGTGLWLSEHPVDASQFARQLIDAPRLPSIEPAYD